MKGYLCALLEVSIFLTISSYIFGHTELHSINWLVCTWLMFTTLTGIWETKYLSSRHDISEYARQLIYNHQHVWTNEYNPIVVWVYYFSKLFYAEYGAWADREYMFYTDGWSFTVEGTHCFICAFFSTLSLLAQINGNTTLFIVLAAIAMSSQLMNSIMYLRQYCIQCATPTSVNYNCSNFPCGSFLMKRPFMWINALWIAMPTFVCAYLVHMTYSMAMHG